MTTNKNLFQYFSEMDKYLELYLVKKAPAIPENIKEIIVKYSPYLMLVATIMMLPLILSIFGLGAFALPFTFLGGVTLGAGFSFGYIFVLAAFLFQIYALKGLFKRELSAWKILYYLTLLNAISALLSFNLGSLIIGSLISFYILFQVKPLYH